MLMTKRKPASVGEVLIEEFMEPMGPGHVPSGPEPSEPLTEDDIPF